MKADLQSMRAEWNLEKGQHSTQYRELWCEMGKMMDPKGIYHNPANSKIKKDHDLHDLEKQMTSIQHRIGNLESKFG